MFGEDPSAMQYACISKSWSFSNQAAPKFLTQFYKLQPPTNTCTAKFGDDRPRDLRD